MMTNKDHFYFSYSLLTVIINNNELDKKNEQSHIASSKFKIN